MSTLNVANIQSLTTSTLPVVKNSAGTEVGRYVRAFVRFNGSGTPSINSSFNVSSITDHGQGDFSIVFQNAFSDANYAFTVGHDGTVNTGHSPNMHAYWTNRVAPTTTAIRMLCYHPMDSAKKSDGSRLCVAIF